MRHRIGRPKFMQSFASSTNPFAFAETDYVVRDGSRSMTGPLVLVTPPTLGTHAASKQYVDGILSGVTTGYVAKAGDTMTGLLTLPNITLTNPFHAATKGYVDNLIASQGAQFVSKNGDAMAGFLTLHASPSSNMHAATKQYVDLAAGSASSGVSAGDTPPATPADGSLWWESDTGVLWMRYNDGTSTQWVEAGGASAFGNFVAKAGDTMTGNLSISASTVSTSPLTGALTVAGGLGVAGAIYVGGGLDIAPFARVRPTLAGSGFEIYGAAAREITMSYYQAGIAQFTTGMKSGEGIWKVFAGDSAGTLLLSVNATGVVNVPATTNSTSTTTGALVVAGGLGVGMAIRWGDYGITGTLTNPAGYLPMYFYENATIGAGIQFMGSSYGSGRSKNLELLTLQTGAQITFAPGSSGATSVAMNTSGTASTSTTTGTLVVAGGVGIGGNLNIGSANHSTIGLNSISGGVSWFRFMFGGAQLYTFVAENGGNTFALRDADETHGVVISQNTNAWAAYSDKRLKYKQNAQTISGLLNKLDKFRLVEYGIDHSEVGVIAQEFIEFMPQLVGRGSDDDRIIDKISERDIWTVQTMNTGLAALQVCKELLERIKHLEHSLTQTTSARTRGGR